MNTTSYFARLERLVLFSQTLFGLPWLLAALLLLTSQCSVVVTPGLLCTILVAFFSARTAGMCFNRLVDRHIDAKNPRTADRPLPTGMVSVAFTRFQAVLFSALFLVAAWMLSSACFWVALCAMVLILAYSYAKRVSFLCHFVLGTIHGLVPVALWAALAQDVTRVPLLLGAALLCQIAASDIIYACQDIDFDRRHKLQSIPALVGAEKALQLAKLFHLAAFVLLFCLSFCFVQPVVLCFGACCVGAVYFLAYSKASFEASFTLANRLSGIVYLCVVVWHVW